MMNAGGAPPPVQPEVSRFGDRPATDQGESSKTKIQPRVLKPQARSQDTGATTGSIQAMGRAAALLKRRELPIQQQASASAGASAGASSSGLYPPMYASNVRAPAAPFVPSGPAAPKRAPETAGKTEAERLAAAEKKGKSAQVKAPQTLAVEATQAQQELLKSSSKLQTIRKACWRDRTPISRESDSPLSSSKSRAARASPRI